MLVHIMVQCQFNLSILHIIGTLHYLLLFLDLFSGKTAGGLHIEAATRETRKVWVEYTIENVYAGTHHLCIVL